MSYKEESRLGRNLKSLFQQKKKKSWRNALTSFTIQAVCREGGKIPTFHNVRSNVVEKDVISSSSISPPVDLSYPQKVGCTFSYARSYI